jgi:hypothetical protein
MVLKQHANRIHGEKRAVPVEHDEAAVMVRDCGAAYFKRVPGTLLFRLHREANACRGEDLLHLRRLVPDYNHNLIRICKRQRRMDNVFDQRPAPGLVQHFRLSRLHSGAQPGSQDNDC